MAPSVLVVVPVLYQYLVSRDLGLPNERECQCFSAHINPMLLNSIYNSNHYFQPAILMASLVSAVVAVLSQLLVASVQAVRCAASVSTRETRSLLKLHDILFIQLKVVGFSKE